MATGPLMTGRQHVAALRRSLAGLEADIGRVVQWGSALTAVLTGGGRLLVAGNGGSAAQAQHLTAELVGRYRDERAPFSAIALHAETSSLTAIANDYGAEEMFARQVRAHARSGDVVLALSTSGRSPSIISAALAAPAGTTTWALTGPAPNPLASLCDDVLAVDAAATCTIQELHLVVIHLLCAEVDANLAAGGRLGLERAR